jgi:hypothetical protein
MKQTNYNSMRRSIEGYCLPVDRRTLFVSWS